MTRISLKEAYDNKDIVAQIYAIRDTAESAEDTAEQAVTTANTASAHVDDAIKKADASAAAVAGFADRLATAESEISAVTPVIESALNTANTAVTTAKTAVATADNAGEKAKTAVNTASDAVKTANTASENANTAIEKANAAVASATDAVARADASASTVAGIENRVITTETEIAALQTDSVTLATEQVIEGKKTFASADGLSVTNDLSVGGALHAETAEIGLVTVRTNPSGYALFESKEGIQFDWDNLTRIVINTAGTSIRSFYIPETPGALDASTKGVNKAFVQDTNGLSNIAHNNQANVFSQKQTIGNASVTTEVYNEKTDNVTSFIVDLQNQANTSNSLILALDSNDTTGQVRLRVQKKIGDVITTYFVPLTTEDTWM